MKYCNDYAALLDLYVDGELTAEEMVRVQDHLDVCPGCRAYVDDALAIRAAFPDAEDTAVPDGFTEAVMAAVRTMPRKQKKTLPWMKVLAPLAACFAIVLVLQHGPSSTKEESNKVSYAMDATADAKTETIAESCAEEAPPEAEEAAPQEAGPEMEPAEPEAFVAVEGANEYKSELELPTVTREAQGSPAEDSANQAVTAAGREVVYQTILYLPAEAAELLADFTPVEETETELHYHLFMSDCALVQARLQEAQINYMAEDAVEPNTNKALVILSK